MGRRGRLRVILLNRDGMGEYPNIAVRVVPATCRS